MSTGTNRILVMNQKLALSSRCHIYRSIICFNISILVNNKDGIFFLSVYCLSYFFTYFQAVKKTCVKQKQITTDYMYMNFSLKV